ncbi:unnamed protein product [Blepharisma stoltei]|uniref:Uncharacterized protein n=1 Tax=Blepharisma stoltei TaxID=1481888 RepID=A0AAU9JF69_9CILI|nr:unnamed protein product [Blepharisma stoltei]
MLGFPFPTPNDNLPLGKNPDLDVRLMLANPKLHSIRQGKYWVDKFKQKTQFQFKEGLIFRKKLKIETILWILMRFYEREYYLILSHYSRVYLDLIILLPLDF